MKLLLTACCRLAARRIAPGLILFLFFISIGVVATPALAQSSGWIPLEDEGEIARRQYPRLHPAPLLLPDLRTLPPTAVSLVIDPDGKGRSLRFSNAVWNAGPGALELHGDYDPESGIIDVVQVVMREEGKPLERTAGQFEYHAEHQHVHWDAFALYQIWSTNADGSLLEVVASSDKVGYCLRDIKPYHPPEETEEELNLVGKSPYAPSQPGFSSCSWRRQGMSVGWYDIYYSYTTGQALDISHLPDGVYALISTADPAQILREGDETNNSAAVYFSLQGDQLSTLEDPNGRSQP